METKHTPGPWTICHNKGYGKGTIVAPNFNASIYNALAQCHFPDKYINGCLSAEAFEIMEANARMIAAAPKMFDRIEKYLNGPDALTWAGMKEAWELATGREWEGPCPIGQNRGDTSSYRH